MERENADFCYALRTMASEQSSLRHIRYRPDVDGLRAVAVLLVLADHLKTRVGGGYVGVDVFFVISGYLISASIMKDLDAGRFTFVAFYERRVRRILPALMVMLAVVSLLVWYLFVPDEIEAYARSMVAALFSVSNLLFWKQAGYFDAPSELKPLLHTWSLGVEEQFYLFFPILVVVLHRWFRPQLKWVVTGLALLSFLLAGVTVRFSAESAFFLAPLRAWELLAGMLLSQRYLPVPGRPLTRNLAAGGGLLLILLPAWIYTSGTRFPGESALPPCLGAVLVIAAGETGSSYLGKLLSWRPIAFVGLISYSLYLWHWPLLVFQQSNAIVFQEPLLSGVEKAVLSLMALALGSLSWLLVERPIRQGRTRPRRSALFWGSGVATASLMSGGAAMIASHGAENRFPPSAQQILTYTKGDQERSFREDVCFLNTHDSLAQFSRRTCLPTHPHKVRAMLAGDSHAADLYAGFAKVFDQLDIQQVTAANCRPLLPESDPSAAPFCQDLRKLLFDDLLTHETVDVLLLAGRWLENELPALGKTLEALHLRGISVVVVGPSIEYDEPEPRLIALAMRADRAMDEKAHRLKAPEVLDHEMATASHGLWHTSYISIYDDLCGVAPCPIFAAPGVPLLFDQDHLTLQGAERLAAVIEHRRQLPLR